MRSAIHGGCSALLNDQTEPCITGAVQRGDTEAAVAPNRAIERLLRDAPFHVLQPVFCLRRELPSLRGKNFCLHRLKKYAIMGYNVQF